MSAGGGSDYGNLRFRARAEQVPRTGLWHIFATVFAAVLLALVVHSLMIWAVSGWQMRKLSSELDAEISKLKAEFSVPDVVRPAGPSRPARPVRQAAPPVPALPGPIEARAQGAERACVSGRIYRRLSNGWDHIGGSCRATSQ